ncbi:hypothetical protein BKN14_01550 [Candidatus Gracilibacteria bacterium HOT-871]|nr:hypothetical protein BKN14_01550 [Candidatus Gracilibacteria bacterium HOT-871]
MTEIDGILTSREMTEVDGFLTYKRMTETDGILSYKGMKQKVLLMSFPGRGESIRLSYFLFFKNVKHLNGFLHSQEGQKLIESGLIKEGKKINETIVSFIFSFF